MLVKCLVIKEKCRSISNKKFQTHLFFSDKILIEKNVMSGGTLVSFIW